MRHDEQEELVVLHFLRRYQLLHLSGPFHKYV